MEFNKCNRCGAFYVSEGAVCPKCAPKDALELSTLKNYIEENGFSSIDIVSAGTGISTKNLNRFLNVDGIGNLGDTLGNNSGNIMKGMNL
ncbi:MAG: hypothetical protein HFJ48_04825 [Clostridia bacterium]|nr:hypothetical protein [Clostridia bacterium]